MLYYRIKASLFNWKEERWVQKMFYRDPLFKALDQDLRAGPNPYHLSRIFPYGETPLKVLHTIAHEVNLKPTDLFVDLGCGRGRAVFFMSHLFGCRAIGVDLTPSFIKRARHLAQTHHQTKVSFEYRDFLTFDFRKATCVYLYGTTYEDAVLERLEKKLEELPEGSSVVTVSAHLVRIPSYKSLEVRFPWGKTEIFFHRKEGLK